MPAKQPMVCKVLLMLISGLAQIVAAISSPMSALQGSSGADCSIPGFTFRPNHVPSLVKPRSHPKHGTLWNPIELYTLPHTPPKDGSGGTNTIIPSFLPNLRATAAACEAEAACGLFTSDGYIIGAYRRTLGAGFMEQVGLEADILLWKPMHYCTWDCCGTWVADGLITQLLQPVPKTPGANSVRTIPEFKLPTDGVMQYELNSELRTTVCVGKPPPQPLVVDKAAASLPGSPGCPKRCLTACCKQLDSGDTTMGNHFFSQCSGQVCRLCGYSKTSVAGWSSQSVLMRQYLREQSRGPAASVPGAGGVSKCDRPNGGAAKTGSGNLC